MSGPEARAVNAITCAAPGCGDKGVELVPMSVNEDGEPVELEFCASHARQYRSGDDDEGDQ